MDDLHNGLNFCVDQKNKIFHHILQGHLKIAKLQFKVKLQSSVAKCYKTREILSCEVCKICIYLYYARKRLSFLPRKLFARNTKSEIFARLCFPFLQHFATRLCNFTNFKMLFSAGVNDLPRCKFSP